MTQEQVKRIVEALKDIAGQLHVSNLLAIERIKLDLDRADRIVGPQLQKRLSRYVDLIERNQKDGTT